MKPILFIPLTVLVFVSCTGRRYEHYGYVKKGEKKEVIKAAKKRLPPTAVLEAKIPEMPPLQVRVDTQSAKTLLVINIVKQEYTTTKSNLQNATNDSILKPTEEPNPGRLNANAVISFGLAVPALVLAIIAFASGVFVTAFLFALILSVFSLLVGLTGRDQIRSGKGKGRGLCMAGISISTLILLVMLVYTFAVVLVLVWRFLVI